MRFVCVLAGAILAAGLSSCSLAPVFSSKPAPVPNKQALNEMKQEAYSDGIVQGIRMERQRLERIGIQQKEEGARVVGGAYIPRHKEYVIARHRLTNRKKQCKKSDFARLTPIPTVGSIADTFKPAPKLDPDTQAKLFETLVNKYDFTDARMLYDNVIFYIDKTKIKDKYDFYEALARFFLIEHEYRKAYDSYLKAYMYSDNDTQKLTCLEGAVTAAKLYKDDRLEITALLNLGDFKLKKGDKLGALECYYKAMKVRETPEAAMRIAKVLETLNKDQLAKAFALKAYIVGEGVRSDGDER